MDLDELRAFVAVAEAGSHLAAAEALGMSRSTLRRKVDALEARAGVALLEATSRGVVLTEAGRALASQARQMVQEMRALLASVRDLGTEPRGSVRVVAPVGMPPQGVTMVYRALREAHPALQYHCRFSEDPVREPLDDVDLAIHFGDHSPGRAWVSFPIHRLRRWLLASPGYLAEHGAPATVDELARRELLAWQGPGEDATRWPTRDGRTLEVRPALISTDLHLLHHLCAAGAGIAYLPDGMLPELTGGPPLTPVLEEVVQGELTVRVSVPKALSEIPKIRLFLGKLSAFFPAA